MKMSVRLTVIVVFISFIQPCMVFAQAPTDESLIKAWESVMKNDPKTEKFEKTEPDTYIFHTTRFPYQGGLVVLNTSIDDSPGTYYGNVMMGVVEVELTDLAEDFYSKHAHSFSMWQQKNYLYYDQDEARWLSAREWQSNIPEDGFASPWWTCLNSIWYFFLLVMVVIVILLSRKASSQMKNAMIAQDKALKQQQKAIDDQQKGLKLNEQSVQLAVEMKDLLEKILMNLEQKMGN